jgi:hypothetical protein
MMIRASEPPMKLRLSVESVTLSLCVLTDVSGREGGYDQQKLLIRRVERHVNKKC